MADTRQFLTFEALEAEEAVEEVVEEVAEEVVEEAADPAAPLVGVRVSAAVPGRWPCPRPRRLV